MVSSRSSIDRPALPSENISFSDLEVASRKEWLEHDEHALPIAGLDSRDGRVDGGGAEEKIVGYSHGKHVLYSQLGKEVTGLYNPHEESPSVEPKVERKLCGIRRTPALIVGAIITFLIVGSVAGIVCGVLGVRAQSRTHSPLLKNATVANTPYGNTGLAALQWSANGTSHRRLYYQDSLQQIQESAWDNNTAFDGAWKVSIVSHPIKPASPLAAMAGYFNANRTRGLVRFPKKGWSFSSDEFIKAKNVYFQTADNGLSSLQTRALGPASWTDDAINGIFETLNSTFLAAYNNEDVEKGSHDIILVFQGGGYSTNLTQARRTVTPDKAYGWGDEKFGFPHAEGATFALAPADYRNRSHVMLYSVDEESSLRQHNYTIGHDRPVSTASINATSSNCKCFLETRQLRDHETMLT